MKRKLSMFLVIAALFSTGIWPPGSLNPKGKRIPIPGNPPIIVVQPGSK